MKGAERLPLALLMALFLSGFFLLTDGFSALAAVESSYNEKLGELQQRLMTRGLSEKDLFRFFSDGRVELIPDIVERKGKGLNYRGRRFGLLTKKSVQEGKGVLRANRGILHKMETTYGVGREILVAILRIETNFGRVKGHYPIFNSLLTMALIENRRSGWAEEELGCLLLMCREEKKDPFSIKGSWAGAFGVPQFVPSSYLKYGVDGNGDGIVDLDNLADAFASIANYLKSFGWSRQNSWKKRKPCLPTTIVTTMSGLFFPMPRPSKGRLVSVRHGSGKA